MRTPIRKKKYLLYSWHLLAFFIFSFSCLAFGDISIVKKGMWQAECAGALISEHNRYDKALESVINNGGNCDILPPSRFEVRTNNTESEAPQEPTTQTIAFSWQIPTQREDGESLPASEVSGYKIRWVGGELVIKGGETTSSTLTLPSGSYSFTISTLTTDGAESKPSAPIVI